MPQGSITGQIGPYTGLLWASQGPPYTGQFSGYARTGALCIDITTPGLWQNTGSISNPTWQKVGSTSPTTSPELAFNVASNSMYAPIAA